MAKTRKPRRVAATVKKAAPRKKSAKKKPTKKASTSIVPASKMITTSMATLKRQAETDYITDPDGNSVSWHYEREDREYSKHVSIETFRKWCSLGKWTERRVQFWDEMQDRMLAHIRDQLFQERMDRLTRNREKASYMAEYLEPLRDEDGEVQRYPMDHEFYPGLPKFPLGLPKMDKFLKAYLDLQSDIRLDSGEAVTRTETISGGRKKASVTALDPVSSLMNLSPDEARSMAKSLMRKRFQSMMEAGEALDAEVIDVEDDGL